MCGAWVSRVVELVHTELDDRPAPISAATNLYKRTESAGSMRHMKRSAQQLPLAT
jgi:hypothetical protein